MGLRVRKSVKLGKGVKLNFSKSGVSTSVKVGNVTLNSKRGTTVRLAKGVSYHVDKPKKRSKSYGTNFKTYNRVQKETLVDKLDRLNGDMKAYEAKAKARTQNQWDRMSDKQTKWYNIFMKTVLTVLTMMLLLLTIVFPFCIILAIASGILAYKFDARKMQSKYKNNKIE